jgi:hypothetical protein
MVYLFVCCFLRCRERWHMAGNPATPAIPERQSQIDHAVVLAGLNTKLVLHGVPTLAAGIESAALRTCRHDSVQHHLTENGNCRMKT